jgi:hypothetical protein
MVFCLCEISLKIFEIGSNSGWLSAKNNIEEGQVPILNMYNVIKTIGWYSNFITDCYTYCSSSRSLIPHAFLALALRSLLFQPVVYCSAQVSLFRRGAFLFSRLGKAHGKLRLFAFRHAAF